MSGTRDEEGNGRTATLGGTKVRDLAPPLVIAEDVVRLEVAVQNTERVEVLETFEDLVGEELDDALLELGGTVSGVGATKGY